MPRKKAHSIGKRPRTSEVGRRFVAPSQEPPKITTSHEEQSGDLQGLPDDPDADSESVRELAEEGQFFEAAIVEGVERARDANEGPVKTHEEKMDDTPAEYTDHEPDEPQE